jgi:hypothetical protein
MTDLLSPLSRTRAAAAEDAGRPLAGSAAIAGLAAPAVVLLGLWVVGLVGWYAADGGSHGTTRSVLRIAADGWLLAHGAHLSLGAVTVTASPLGLSLVCLLVTYRWGRWAGARSGPTDLHAVGLATIVLSGVYGILALLVALLASAPGVDPGPKLAFLGGALVGAVAGGAGLVRGAGLASSLRRSVPVPGLSVAYGALAAVTAMVTLGAVLTAVALAVHLPAAARVTEGLRLDLTDGILSLVLLAALLPNVALMGASYLLGPGFAVGVGTTVSPGDVTLGPVPSLPVLAALPSEGWTPGWAMGFLAVPVLVGVGAAMLAGRVLPTRSFQAGAARGLGAGLLGSLVLAISTSYAGGAIGPGRMTDLGAGFWPVLSAGVLSLGCGGAVGGVLAAWWTRRQDVPEAVHPERPATPPTVKPLAGPDDLTEPVHLPAVTADPLVPAPRRDAVDHSSDLSTEDTVQLRLPPSR